MNSLEKVHALLAHVQAMPDDELADAIPLPMIPPPLARSMIEIIKPQLPADPDELDVWLAKIAEFSEALKSDEQPAAA